VSSLPNDPDVITRVFLVSRGCFPWENKRSLTAETAEIAECRGARLVRLYLFSAPSALSAVK